MVPQARSLGNIAMDARARRLIAALLVPVAIAACTRTPVYTPPPRIMVPRTPGGQPSASARAPELAAPEPSLPPPEALPIPPPAPPASSGATAALLDQSRQQSAAGNFPMATSSLERALRINPRDPGLWLELGRVKLRQRDFVQAESMGRRASAIAGTDPRWRGQIDELLDAARRGQGK
jgi:hypothetical protein